MTQDLADKYPFFASLPWFEDEELVCYQKTYGVSLKKFLEDKNPKLALILGVDVAIDAEHLLFWLEQDKSRRVVFFEKRPKSLEQFLSQKSTYLMHPHLHIRFLQKLDDFVDALVQEVASYPADQLQILLSQTYKELLDEKTLQVEVLRKASLITSFFHEAAWYHLLCDNLFPNFKELSRAFYADCLHNSFLNKPAIICGAGPSLDTQAAILQQLQDKAFIIAGGSTLSALASLGVKAHLGFALDPNPEEYERLHKAYGNSYPLFFGGRLEKRVLKAWKGPIGYMKTSSGGFLEQRIQNLLGLDQEPLLKGLSEEALSVTTMALSAAVSLGCNPIYLAGIDLAFVDNKRYAAGVINELDNHSFEHTTTCVNERVFCLSKDNKQVETTIKWIMEKDAIEAFAKDHPNICFFDCVKQGLGFPSLPSFCLEKLIELPNIYPQKLVMQALANAKPCCQDPDKLAEFFDEIKQSLQASLELVNTMLLFCSLNQHDDSYDPEQSAKGTLCLLDLEEQPCFNWLLQPLEPYTQALFAKPCERWRHYQELIMIYLGKI